MIAWPDPKEAAMGPQTETYKIEGRPLFFSRLVHEAPSLLWAPRANGRKKNRSGELLCALPLRYEHAPVYEALPQHKRACSELEKLYAEKRQSGSDHAKQQTLQHKTPDFGPNKAL